MSEFGILAIAIAIITTIGIVYGPEGKESCATVEWQGNIINVCEGDTMKYQVDSVDVIKVYFKK